jgi:hypothetical protein
MSIEATVEQARVLRELAERIEQGGETLSAGFEQALLHELEDHLDLEALRAAREEPGALAWEAVKAELGE